MKSDRRRNRFSQSLVIVCAVTAAWGTTGAAVAADFPDGSRAFALVRPDDSASSSGMVTTTTGPYGKLVITKKGDHQSFVLDAYGLSPAPGGGYGVFIGDSIEATNGAFFVNVLSNVGSNGYWRVALDSNHGAPAQLGAVDVSELAGLFIFVADGGTNVTLRTQVTPLVPKPAALGFNKQVSMARPAPAPSLHATGVIHVRYNGRTGASLLDVRVRHLAKGNTYCAYIVPVPGMDAPNCDGGENLSTGNGFVTHDTGKGQDLPGGLSRGILTVRDLSGLFVEIRDAFGVTHLSAQIP